MHPESNRGRRYDSESICPDLLTYCRQVVSCDEAILPLPLLSSLPSFRAPRHCWLPPAAAAFDCLLGLALLRHHTRCLLDPGSLLLGAFELDEPHEVMEGLDQQEQVQAGPFTTRGEGQSYFSDLIIRSNLCTEQCTSDDSFEQVGRRTIIHPEDM